MIFERAMTIIFLFIFVVFSSVGIGLFVRLLFKKLGEKLK